MYLNKQNRKRIKTEGHTYTFKRTQKNIKTNIYTDEK